MKFIFLLITQYASIIETSIYDKILLNITHTTTILLFLYSNYDKRIMKIKFNTYECMKMLTKKIAKCLLSRLAQFGLKRGRFSPNCTNLESTPKEEVFFFLFY